MQLSEENGKKKLSFWKLYPVIIRKKTFKEKKFSFPVPLNNHGVLHSMASGFINKNIWNFELSSFLFAVLFVCLFKIGFRMDKMIIFYGFNEIWSYSSSENHHKIDRVSIHFKYIQNTKKTRNFNFPSNHSSIHSFIHFTLPGFNQSFHHKHITHLGLFFICQVSLSLYVFFFSFCFSWSILSFFFGLNNDARK